MHRGRPTSPAPVPPLDDPDFVYDSPYESSEHLPSCLLVARKSEISHTSLTGRFNEFETNKHRGRFPSDLSFDEGGKHIGPQCGFYVENYPYDQFPRSRIAYPGQHMKKDMFQRTYEEFVNVISLCKKESVKSIQSTWFPPLNICQKLCG